MGELGIALTKTKARSEFKKRSGHTTQHLLTLVVGAAAVEAGAAAPASLPATWNPVSRSDAAQRARTFALQSSLVWTIESVIGYVSDVSRAQPPVISEHLINAIRNEKDKEQKLLKLAQGTSAQTDSALAVVRAGYVWRNRVTHYGAHNLLDSIVKAHLLKNHNFIDSHFSGLNVTEMCKRIEENFPPRLKETAAVIRASAEVVRSIDEAIVEIRGTLPYLKDVLRAHLRPGDGINQGQRAAGLWGGTEAKNRHSLEVFAVRNGLSASSITSTDDEGMAAWLPRDAIQNLLGTATR